MKKNKKKLCSVLAAVIAMGIMSLFTGCGSSSGGISNDYKPGNPQYDYDAWKYGQDHPGFYD